MRSISNSGSLGTRGQFAGMRERAAGFTTWTAISSLELLTLVLMALASTMSSARQRPAASAQHAPAPSNQHGIWRTPAFMRASKPFVEEKRSVYQILNRLQTRRRGIFGITSGR